ncbi:MAG: FkbM family methyltransferase, partial [Verrucomicrobiota bacterium]
PAEALTLDDSAWTYQRLGTTYGGWHYPIGGIGKGDAAITAGAGEDLSFDVALARVAGCEVLILDPTPRAKAHFDELAKRTREGELFEINAEDGNHYAIEESDLELLRFEEVVFWNETTTLKFFAPRNPKHVSHSALEPADEREIGFQAKCCTFDEIQRAFGLPKVRFLKLDIEGAEDVVLDQILERAADIDLYFVQVEFHRLGDEKVGDVAIRWTNHFREAGWKLVIREGNNYCYERPGLSQ